MTNLKWNIGCSGYHYADWKGKFYPEKLAKTKWFEYYTRFFKTLELNNTFYRFPRLENLENWYNISPPEFTFAVKIPRAITHYRKFNDCDRMLSDVYTAVENGLKEKTGCLLFQLHPHTHYNEEKLKMMLNCMSSNFHNVLEFRHASWWNKTVYEMLAEKDVTFCSMSHPELPDEVVINTKNVYYRFHGVPLLYRSSYSNKFMKHITNEINTNDKVKNAFVYFNNDYDAVAVDNALKMKDIALENLKVNK